MSCQKHLTYTGIITLILALIGYLIFEAFIVPINAECDYMSVIPEGAAVDMSLSDWVYGNMMAGVIFFSLLASFSKNTKRGSNNCALGLLMGLFCFYCLFEIAWTILGFMINTQFYKDACSYSDSFNLLIMVELVYGAILFSLIILTALIVVLTIIR